MAKDPAFLFYPGDWLGGTMGMTFEQKGAYFELLVFQFNNGPFTEAQAKQVLSICFASVWHMVSTKFKTDGKFFWSARLSSEIEKRKEFSKSRSDNAKGIKKVKTTPQKGEAYAKHMENENRNENDNAVLDEYENWSRQIQDGNDQYFEEEYMSEGLKLSPERFTDLIRDHLGLLNRYPKMRPTTQQRFRKSLLKHIRENKDKINGKQRTSAADKFEQAARIITGK